MRLPWRTSLFLHPANQDIEAHIVEVSPALMDRITPGWWNDPSLDAHPNPPPIDRDWTWTDTAIEFGDRVLAGRNLAIVTGDGEVQGAMLVSVDRIESHLEPGTTAFFVERLFAAPRNRPRLRADKNPYFSGAGVELLRWAVTFSQEQGCEGRLRLESSPEALDWYQRRGLQVLPLHPTMFEGVEYTPMELPVAASRRFLE